MTFVDRIVEVERTLPIPVPKGYRKATDADSDLGFEVVRPSPEVVEEIFAVPRFPVSHGPYVRKDVSSAPKPIQDLAADLFKACTKAKPQERHEIQTIIFVYSLEERRWKLTKPERG